jgi:hypothetical protein
MAHRRHSIQGRAFAFENIEVIGLVPTTKHIRARLMNGVAASRCRGVPAQLPTPARLYSAVATWVRIDAMAFGLYMLFAVAIQGLCYADVTKLPAEDRRMLQDSARFHDVHSTSALPSAILALCDGGGDGKLAEPGQKWNATCVITDPTLPGKRLIWAAVGSEYYVVHYERGGIEHSFHILVAKLAKSDAKATLVWRAMGGPFKDYAAFLDALRSGKLDDRLDYPH